MQGLGLRWHWPRTSALVTAGTEEVPASDRKKATQVLFKAAPPGVWQGVGAPSHRGREGDVFRFLCRDMGRKEVEERE